MSRYELHYSSTSSMQVVYLFGMAVVLDCMCVLAAAVCIMVWRWMAVWSCCIGISVWNCSRRLQVHLGVFRSLACAAAPFADSVGL